MELVTEPRINRIARYDGRWGTLNRRDAIAPGIDWIDGTSHGGFILTAGRLAKMPAELRAESFTNDNYFEEDCSAAAVVVAFPEHFHPERVIGAAMHLDQIRAFRASRTATLAEGGAR